MEKEVVVGMILILAIGFSQLSIVPQQVSAANERQPWLKLDTNLTAGSGGQFGGYLRVNASDVIIFNYISGQVNTSVFQLSYSTTNGAINWSSDLLEYVGYSGFGPWINTASASYYWHYGIEWSVGSTPKTEWIRVGASDIIYVKVSHTPNSNVKYKITVIKGEPNINDMNTTLNNLQNQITDLSENISNLQNQIIALTTQINTLNSTITTMNKTEQQMLVNITNLWKSYDKLNASLNDIIKTVNDLNTSTSQNISRIEQNVTKIKADINDIQNSIKRLSTNKTDISKLQNQINQTVQEIENTDNNITKIQKTIPTAYNDTLLKNQIAQLRKENAQLRSNIDTLNKTKPEKIIEKKADNTVSYGALALGIVALLVGIIAIVSKKPKVPISSENAIKSESKDYEEIDDKPKHIPKGKAKKIR